MRPDERHGSTGLLLQLQASERDVLFQFFHFVALQSNSRKARFISGNAGRSPGADHWRSLEHRDLMDRKRSPVKDPSKRKRHLARMKGYHDLASSCFRSSPERRYIHLGTGPAQPEAAHKSATFIATSHFVFPLNKAVRTIVSLYPLARNSTITKMQIRLSIIATVAALVSLTAASPVLTEVVGEYTEGQSCSSDAHPMGWQYVLLLAYASKVSVSCFA